LLRLLNQGPLVRLVLQRLLQEQVLLLVQVLLLLLLVLQEQLLPSYRMLLEQVLPNLERLHFSYFSPNLQIEKGF
jgi:hypothetical protein